MIRKGIMVLNKKKVGSDYMGFCDKYGETLEQVAQTGGRCPIPGNIGRSAWTRL